MSTARSPASAATAGVAGSSSCCPTAAGSTTSRPSHGRRGGTPELLAFREDGRWVDVTSADINRYLKAATGDDFSAKDFRTWNGTVIAAALLAGDVPETKTARRRRVNEAVKGVAFFLGNTPAVCRASYIDPRVLDRFQSGWTIAVEMRPDEDPFAQGRRSWSDRRRRLSRACSDSRSHAVVRAADLAPDAPRPRH